MFVLFVSVGSVDKTTLIIGISVSSIIFIGIIIIIIYRCLLELYDIREYQNFVKMQKQTEWKEVMYMQRHCIIKHLNTVSFVGFKCRANYNLCRQHIVCFSIKLKHLQNDYVTIKCLFVLYRSRILFSKVPQQRCITLCMSKMKTKWI